MKIEKNTIFAEWMGTTLIPFLKRISCKNRSWQFTLRKHSKSWEETRGCLNFHCGTTFAAQWGDRKKKKKGTPATGWEERKISWDYTSSEQRMRPVSNPGREGAGKKGTYMCVLRRIAKRIL